MLVDINEVVQEIKTTASAIAGKDISTIRGFSNRQVLAIANQAALVASGINTGQITEATRDFFLEQLVELAQNFAEALVGLLTVTIERIWNAIVQILWRVISSATGLPLSDYQPR